MGYNGVYLLFPALEGFYEEVPKNCIKRAFFIDAE